MPGELDGGIQAEGPRVEALKRLNHGHERFADAVFPAPGAPSFDGLGCIGKQCGPVDKKQRSVADVDVPWILEILGNVLDEVKVVLGRMFLADEQVLFPPVPAPCPVLVGPAQAEGEVDGTVVQIIQYRCFQQTMSCKPVEVEAEAADPVALGDFHLAVLNLDVPKIVVAHVDGHPWLVMAGELRRCRANVGPLGEPFPPPLVILRDCMELGQIERDQSHRPRGRCIAPELRQEQRSGGFAGGIRIRTRAVLRQRGGGGPQPVAHAPRDEGAYPSGCMPAVKRQHGLGRLAELPRTEPSGDLRETNEFADQPRHCELAPANRRGQPPTRGLQQGIDAAVALVDRPHEGIDLLLPVDIRFIQHRSQ